MSLANVYTQVYGQLSDFFQKIQEGQAPAKFTQQHLKDIGFASTNHRSFIPILKAIGFLSDDGTPTTRYHDYRNTSQAKIIMGEALKEAYSDLFTIKAHPTQNDKELFEGKFKSANNCSERPAELMTKTFFALLDLADVNHSTKTRETSKPENEKFEEKKESSYGKNERIEMPGLHYTIQIHLPATKDIEVYNSIFKSIKEHLIG